MSWLTSAQFCGVTVWIWNVPQKLTCQKLCPQLVELLWSGRNFWGLVGESWSFGPNLGREYCNPWHFLCNFLPGCSEVSNQEERSSLPCAPRHDVLLHHKPMAMRPYDYGLSTLKLWAKIKFLPFNLFISGIL
jgi:hypothetical protein